MEGEEFKVSFKGILFSRRRVRNEIKWKLEKIMMVKVYGFSVLYSHVSDL